MGVVERKSRERAERECRIRTAARTIAAEEGWDAVTIRRLAEAIEFSQPVVYSHFENRDAIIAAVALEGFRELGDVLRHAAKGRAGGHDALHAVASAYLTFADEQPTLYDAMFTMPTSLRFAQTDTPPDLRAAFAALAAVVPGQGVETAAETFWAALHGLAALQRSGRIRRAAQNERVELAIGGLLRQRHRSTSLSKVSKARKALSTTSS